VGDDPKPGSAGAGDGGLFDWLSTVVRGPGAPPAPTSGTAHPTQHAKDTGAGRSPASTDQGHLFQLLGLVLGLVAAGGGLVAVGFVNFVGRRKRGAPTDADADAEGVATDDTEADPGRAEAPAPAA
jgi:hypothetical protein